MPLTLWSQGITAPLSADPTAYTLGVEFQVTAPGFQLDGIWFYSPAGAVAVPSTIALYQVAGASLVTSQAASWSGAAGSGWVFAAFASPPPLAAATFYKACVLQPVGANWYGHISNYWDTGDGAAGITNGALSAPANAGSSPGQDSFTQAAVLSYPASVFNAPNYLVDPQVSAPGGGGPASSVVPDFCLGMA